MQRSSVGAIEVMHECMGMYVCTSPSIIHCGNVLAITCIYICSASCMHPPPLQYGVYDYIGPCNSANPDVDIYI
jgi:hypothetical protein